MYVVSPLVESCPASVIEAEHACVGISPFNGYFTPERINELAAWAVRTFPSCHFFVPDGPSVHTLEALGYSPSKARSKARRQGCYVYNKIHKALSELGVPDPGALILDSAALEHNPDYQRLLAHGEQLYRVDEEFRAACLRASHWVLDRKLPDGQRPSPEQLAKAVRYFLAELPLFADTTGIVGRRASVFVYHQRVAFLERFYRRELSWKPAAGQGFLVVTPVGELVSATAS
ncbi:tRNA-dependent cyclodipeptide synthase [Crossiella cryophila]|uniref:Cyclodipeptide synthase n=1 Tax=Crossiella cryophila TaxID=43355 RepID=A0A7W7FRY6_9PSEU|nr:tRNA-dependent cyclodipeptide synthase [Crossiella cryophila]MBB4675592.1 cyclo(L-tyrosyl-L-tyrosyl) synthase [Crossiella cryophila]